MSELKGSRIYKTIAIVLCLFMAFEIHYVLAYQTTEELKIQFVSAKDFYFEADYETAKATLENLVTTLTGLEGMDTLKGEAYLLLGAAYEKLEYNNLAIKYYCLAKEILGEGKSTEGIDLNTLPLYWTKCLTADGMAISALIIQYEEGHQAFCAGDYDGAKTILEKLVSQLDPLEGWDSLKGETYLVLGASYEEFKLKDLAIKYYCRAKDILGEGVTVDCIQLNKQKWYRANCADPAAARIQKRKRGGFGGFIGMILGIGLIAGLIWYLFFSKNAPLKKNGNGGNGPEPVTNYCLTTSWHFSTSVNGDPGNFEITPSPSANVPQPSEANGYDDSKTYNWSMSGGTFKTVIGIDFHGGNGIQVTHTIYIDGSQTLKKTYTHTRDCNGPADWEENPGFWEITTTGDHTFRHVMEFVLPSGETGIVNNAVSVTIK